MVLSLDVLTTREGKWEAGLWRLDARSVAALSGRVYLVKSNVT